MKHLQLYENFDVGDEIASRDSFRGKNGDLIFFWEEEHDGMAGEPIYIWKFRVDGTEEDVFYKEVKDLLRPEDQREMEKLIKRTEKENHQNAISWTI